MLIVDFRLRLGMLDLDSKFEHEFFSFRRLRPILR
jgi:hypothetical protein